MKKLFIRIKALLLIFALVVSTLLFVGCTYRGYNGDYPELCSVAWASIPTLTGFASNGEVLYDARVEILENDSYGRVLFTYSESYGVNSFYVMIVQYSDAANAYYYPDDCYIYMICENKDALIDLDTYEIEELKTLNDWNEPLDESKCEGTEIVRKKPEGKIKVSNSYFEEIVREYHENSGRYIHPKNISFLGYYRFGISDDYGREMYVVNTNFEEYTDKTETYYEYVFLIVVNPDKSYDPATVVILENLANPRDEVKNIKAQTGWNTPR